MRVFPFHEQLTASGLAHALSAGLLSMPQYIPQSRSPGASKGPRSGLPEILYVTTSTFEATYTAACHGAKEDVWRRGVLRDLGVSQTVSEPSDMHTVLNVKHRQCPVPQDVCRRPICSLLSVRFYKRRSLLRTRDGVTAVSSPKCS